MRSARRHEEHGFSLAEALAALLVLAISVLAIVPMSIVATHSVTAAAELKAAMLVQAKIEELRATAFEDLAPGTQTETVRLGALSFRRTWIVANNTPHPGMKSVTVRIESLRKSRLRAPRTPVEVTFYHVP